MNLKSILPSTAFLALLAVSNLAAAENASVTAVQPPVWLERGNSYEPLMPGKALQDGDVIVTGGGGRAVVAIGRSGTLRQGAASRTSFLKLGAGNVGKTTISVEAGAMNLQTAAANTQQPPQFRVVLKSASVDISSGGTRFSGETEKNLDIACLLAGAATVTTNADGSSKQLDSSGTCYVQELDKNGPPMVKDITADQINLVANITAENQDRPVISQAGKWAVNVASFEAQKDAKEFLTLLFKAGYPAVVDTVNVKGRQWNRISVPGFADKAQANAYKSLMKETFGAGSAWVAKR